MQVWLVRYLLSSLKPPSLGLKGFFPLETELAVVGGLKMGGAPADCCWNEAEVEVEMEMDGVSSFLLLFDIES